MTHTELLNHIRLELKNQGVVWKREQDFFEFLLPDKNWKKFRSTWYSWKPTKDGLYTTHNLSKSTHILAIIAEKFHLNMSVWEASSPVQIRAVEQGLKAYFLKEDALDISEIIPQFTLSEVQEQLLKKLKIMPLFNMKKILDEHPECFTRTFPNQPFLLALLNILYAKGAYAFLVEKVFPNLMAHQRSNVHVKILEAHVLGSLEKPRFMEAVKLLDSIESDDTDEIIDLKTAAISNLRRFHVANSNFSDARLKEGLARTIKTYYQIYCYKRKYHYYPAINLMYALDLASRLGVETIDIDTKILYRQAKVSMVKEQSSNDRDLQYYASVSELEFLLLLGKQGVMREMGRMLERLTPLVTMVERTERQMVEFLAMAERLGADLGVMKVEFKKVIGLLEDYKKVNHGE